LTHIFIFFGNSLLMLVVVGPLLVTWVMTVRMRKSPRASLRLASALVLSLGFSLWLFAVAFYPGIGPVDPVAYYSGERILKLPSLLAALVGSVLALAFRKAAAHYISGITLVFLWLNTNVT